MPTPDVLDGMRAPRSVRLEAIQARAAQPEVPNVVSAPGVTTYVSRYKRYRVQITAPQSGFNPVTGQPIPMGRELVAQFEEFVFRNTERDPEARELIDRTLQSNPYFGKFNGGVNIHYWLADEQKAAQEAAKLNAALDTLKGLPKEALEQYVAQLTQGRESDHELPPPTPAPAVADTAAEIANAVETAVAKGAQPVKQKK